VSACRWVHTQGQDYRQGPIPGFARLQAGIRPGGHALSAVKDATRRTLNTTENRRYLKGRAGFREDRDFTRGTPRDLMVFTVIRDEIRSKSVSDACWVDDGIAFIRVSQL